MGRSLFYPAPGARPSVANGLPAGARRAQRSFDYGGFSPAKPAYQERVLVSPTRSWLGIISAPFSKEDMQMKRHVAVAVLVLAGVVSLAAQAPKGWRVRVDRSTSASDPDAAGAVKFVTGGSGFHATTPHLAVFWNPGKTATGT